MPTPTSTSTPSSATVHAPARKRERRRAEKWPLWKTYLFILVFCTLAWGAIFLVIFTAI
ncbi:hypothetical protein [Henriciella mobilis]|uniref:hypothetical protein n=1 Tax=Henriciella mobilis TaxID=2305467 RepID=UPI0013142C3A|nr:hypothetical protein [Henriciella mobilis]